MSDWQPIETAQIKPFDAANWYRTHSEYVFLAERGRVFMGAYGFTKGGKGRWQDHHGRNSNPDHWMPIPKPPTGAKA